MCTSEILGNLKEGSGVSPERDIDRDIVVWAGKVRTGDFITIKMAGPENGGNVGRLREAWANDWWVFDTVNSLEKQCVR